MRHARLRARLGPYLEGELDRRGAARVEAHLETCARCRDELAALRRTVELLHALPPAQAPAGLAERILAQVEAAPPGGFGAWLTRHAGALSAAVPLAVGAVGVLLVLPRLELTVRLGPGLQASPPAVSESDAPASAPSAESGSAASAPAPTAPATRVRSVAAAAGAAAPDATASSPSESPPSAPRAAAFAGSPSPLPPRASCARGEGAPSSECARWHAWMVGLAMRDPAVFLSEMEALPSEAQERWIRELSSFAADAGAASVLATQLRASGDPRAARIAPRFERVNALPRR